MSRDTILCPTIVLLTLHAGEKIRPCIIFVVGFVSHPWVFWPSGKISCGGYSSPNDVLHSSDPQNTCNCFILTTHFSSSKITCRVHCPIQYGTVCYNIIPYHTTLHTALAFNVAWPFKNEPTPAPAVWELPIVSLVNFLPVRFMDLRISVLSSGDRSFIHSSKCPSLFKLSSTTRSTNSRGLRGQ